MGNIGAAFARLRKERRKALIGYVTAGFPTKTSLPLLIPLLAEAGLDIIEIGVPFSDPIADGPTIQHSSHIALQNGVTLSWVLASVKRLRRAGVTAPLVLMTYSNPIFAMGVDRFFAKARMAGVDGLIIPDMIPEEALSYAKAAKRNGVDLIYLVAPTTPKSRIGVIARQTRGFLYAVSLTGVTGARQALPAHVSAFLKSVKAASQKPVAVGFGLSTPEQVKTIAQDADGVIVGSALIREIEKSRKTSFKGAAGYVKSLRRALDSLKGASHVS